MRIRCAADLFDVLSNGSMAAQLAVLGGILENPRRAIALGRHDEEDLVDLLVRLIPLNGGSIKQLQLLCLMSFDDPRAAAFMASEFARNRDATSVLHLGKRLSVEYGIDFFRPFLWHQGAAQALAAARFCSQEPDLTAKEKLRVALVLDQEYQPPALSEGTLQAWLDELGGRHRVRVRQMAEQRGPELLTLWTRYGDLEETDQEWLLASTARLDPGFLKERLPGLLRQPGVSFGVAQQALLLDVPLPPGLLQSDHELVRGLAISAGLADDRLERFFGAAASVAEAVAAASRCSSTRLVELLGDPRWEVRAAATDMLSQREDAPLHELRRAASSLTLGERVAAAEVLRRLGDTQWLEEHFRLDEQS